MLSDELKETLNAAIVDTQRRRHEYVTLEHLLLALLDDPNAREVIEGCGGDVDRLRAQLEDFLEFDFSYEQNCIDDDPNRCTNYHGFERLFSELLIMMGDESYTQSYASRFDLAGNTERSFEGELFEDGGINLSGIAGNEMYLLHQAVEYYQEALDRFYGQSKLMWLAVTEDLSVPLNFESSHGDLCSIVGR